MPLYAHDHIKSAVFDYRAFGKRVQYLRRERNLTQEELAEKANISTSFVGHIERAEKQCSVETLASLCRALNADAHL